MSSTPSAPLLVADPDTSTRARTAAALRGAGWTVVEATSPEEAWALAGDGVQAALVDPRAAGDDPAGFVRKLRTSAGRHLAVLLVLDPAAELDCEPWTAAGFDEFVEHPPRPALVGLRLRRLAASEESDGGSWMDPAAFAAHLAGRLGSAGCEERKVAVLAAVIEAPGLDLEGLSADTERVLRDRVAGCMLGAFEDTDDVGSLAPLLPGVRLSSGADGAVLMMIPGITRLQDAAKLGARVQEQLARPLELDGVAVDPQVGLGVAAFPEDGRDPALLVENATAAARRARLEDAPLMVFHTEAMGRWAFERLTLERSLRRAISNEELRVYYQPRVDAETRRIKGMECLVRWQHPELGLVPPAQFIPLAEETGLIVPIGEWVLREACRQNQAWRELGLPDIAVSVNLSPVQFRSDDLYDVVMDALGQAGLAESGLELEVTESMLMDDPKKTAGVLERIKGAGIHISIDDFGTGYSSLSYLKRFPIDALKIDRSFVMNVTTDPDDAAIATAIILMGHSLKLSIVAEGVETESQLEFLRVLQCNEIQGYLFSPPVAAEQAERLLREQAGAVHAA